MPVPLVVEPLPPGAARAHGTPLQRMAKPSTPTPGNVATGAAVPRTSAITKRSDAVTRASFTSPAFVDAQRAVASALTALPPPIPTRTSSAPVSATSGAHARAAHAHAARARAARGGSLRVSVSSESPGTGLSPSQPELPTLRLADLAPAVVQQLPEVEGIAWYRLRAEGGRVARVSVPASDVVDAMRLRIRALEGKVIKLEDVMEKQRQLPPSQGQTVDAEMTERLKHSVHGETTIGRKNSARRVGRGGTQDVLPGAYDRSRGRGRSSLGGANGCEDTSVGRVGRVHGSKRRSVGGLLEGGAMGARTRGIRSVFGGRRTRSKAWADADSDPYGDCSQLLQGLGGTDGAVRRNDAPGRVEFGSSSVIGCGDTFPKPPRSPRGREDLLHNRPLSAEEHSPSDRPSRAFSSSLPRGSTVWDAAAISPTAGISSGDFDVVDREKCPGSASRALDGVSRGSTKVGVVHASNSHEDGHDVDGASRAAASTDEVGSGTRRGPSYVSAISGDSRTGISCPIWEDVTESGIFRRFAVPGEAEIRLSKTAAADAANLTSSSVSSDSGEPGGRAQRNDVREEPEDDLPDAPDAPNVVLPSPRGYKNVDVISSSSGKGGGAELSRESKFKGEGLRWSNRLRRAGSGRR